MEYLLLFQCKRASILRYTYIVSFVHFSLHTSQKTKPAADCTNCNQIPFITGFFIERSHLLAEGSAVTTCLYHSRPLQETKEAEGEIVSRRLPDGVVARVSRRLQCHGLGATLVGADSGSWRLWRWYGGLVHRHKCIQCFG